MTKEELLNNIIPAGNSAGTTAATQVQQPTTAAVVQQPVVQQTPAANAAGTTAQSQVQQQPTAQSQVAQQQTTAAAKPQPKRRRISLLLSRVISAELPSRKVLMSTMSRVMASRRRVLMVVEMRQPPICKQMAKI
jgi:hypothetical protein